MPQLVLLLFILISCGKSSSGPGDVTSIQGITSTYDLPALAGVTIQHDLIKEETFNGVRRIDEKAQVTADDAFHLGSCTKAMTATLAGILVEEGLLRWDDKLSNLLPDVALHESFRNVSFDLLLVHRAGLSADEDALLKKIRPMSGVTGKETILIDMLSRSPQFIPGASSQYSNYGYIIAGRIFERLTGKTFEELMKEKIFAPLAMNTCGFGPAPLVYGHSRMNGVLIPQSWDNPAAFSPAGRVHCSLRDWGKFLRIHLHGFKGQSSLVSRETFQKLHSTHPLKDSSYTYGGWLRNQRTWARGATLSHTGSNTINYANVWIAPEADTIFMSVTNVGDKEAFEATDSAIKLMIKSHLTN